MDDQGQLGSTRRFDNIGLNALYYRMEGVSCNIASILLLHKVSGDQRERERFKNRYISCSDNWPFYMEWANDDGSGPIFSRKICVQTTKRLWLSPEQHFV